MNRKSIWLYLLLPIVLSIATLIVAFSYQSISSHQWFYISCLGFFIGMACISNLVGMKTTGSPNKSLFGAIALAAMSIKMMFAAIIAILYLHFHPGITKWFILPFFLLYLYFAVYETYALIRIGRHPYHKKK